MSLRLRLTLLYTTLLGGIILFFGALVYGLVSILMLQQIDNTLYQAANQIIAQIRVTSANQVDPRSIANIQFNEAIILQVWGNNHDLVIVNPPSMKVIMDDSSYRTRQNTLNSLIHGNFHLRVLSIPIKTVRGSVGVVQVAYNLTLLDAIQRTLSMVLIMLTILSMIFSGLAVWGINGQALAPLATVTNTATNITRADDLSRRIPIFGNSNDEVSRLIRAFNQTLERLEKLFTTQQRFVEDVSHELRTPLTVIKGNISLMQRMGTTDKESLNSIEEEVNRLTRLVGDLLLLAQAESGRLPMSMKPLELDTILMEVFQQARLLAGERLQIRIIEIDQIEVIGDPDRLKQVLINLISNAIQYTPPGGQVSLSLQRIDNRAQLMIRDTGPGIPSEDISHIFERFYRGEKSRTRSKGGGFGLGLSIAYWIVNKHNGTIEVVSKEDSGTTFIVWLPAKPMPEQFNN